MPVQKMPLQTDDDFQLWLQLKKGDKDAFALLFDRYHTTLFNYGIKLLPQRADVVEDAVQDLFIDLWRLRGGLTADVQSVKFYLFRSMRRRLYTASRIKADVSFDEVCSEKYLQQDSHEAALVQNEYKREKELKLKSQIDLLPKRQKEVLTLKYFEGFNNQDIAQIMGVSEKSVRNFLYKALATLRGNQDWVVASLTMAVIL